MGAERKIVQNTLFFVGNAMPPKFVKVQTIFLRNFVVVAQAPKKAKASLNTYLCVCLKTTLAAKE